MILAQLEIIKKMGKGKDLGMEKQLHESKKTLYFKSFIQ
ncbi:hypothetical protein SRABI96_05201 [Peribacillus sp. Bi96]|nr:hypothetical protein SRABI96_05201 [Peribacillus sp. Bi96]